MKNLEPLTKQELVNTNGGDVGTGEILLGGVIGFFLGWLIKKLFD